MRSRIRRPVTFAIVGLVCFAVQYGLLSLAAAAGVAPTLANAAGFFASAQLNFLLSARLTWADRSGSSGRQWLSYQGTALLALVVNTVVFACALPWVGALVAAAFGVVVGAGVTFLVAHHVVFRPVRREEVVA